MRILHGTYLDCNVLYETVLECPACRYSQCAPSRSDLDYLGKYLLRYYFSTSRGVGLVGTWAGPGEGNAWLDNPH